MRDPKDILINSKQLSDILNSHREYILSGRGERSDLTGADLTGAYLRDADLRGADLRGADLTGADLTGAYLTGADLTGAYLTGAYLTGADLTGADLTGAYLTGADLTGADLRDADLTGAKGLYYAAAITSILPDGDIIGWKKLKKGLIAKLLIPASAKRSNSTGRKCRAEYATVLEIWNGDESVNAGVSAYSDTFVYKVGETVYPENGFDENRWEECAGGIHFFITRLEAERY
jgi:hypothetical protein